MERWWATSDTSERYAKSPLGWSWRLGIGGMLRRGTGGWAASIPIKVVAMVGCMTQGISAQEPTSWSADQEQCRTAQRDLEEMSPLEARFPAMRALSRCGAAGGQLIASQLSSIRTASDTVSLRKVVPEFLRMRDASILIAATELASDQSATLETRIGGIMIIVTQARSDIRTAYHDFILRDGPQFSGAVIGPPIGRQGAPFPTGWQGRTDSILSSIMEDPTESEAMRWAANRGVFYLRAMGNSPGLD